MNEKEIILAQIRANMYNTKLSDKDFRQFIRNSLPVWESKDENCQKCEGWGCLNCCDSEVEIRAKQGIHG